MHLCWLCLHSNDASKYDLHGATEICVEIAPCRRSDSMRNSTLGASIRRIKPRYNDFTEMTSNLANEHSIAIRKCETTMSLIDDNILSKMNI